jgi:hypothetical protein
MPGRIGADVSPMGETSVQRWRKYGKDRLYANAGDGTRLGWHDVLTGEDHVEVAGREQDFYTAIAQWRTDAGSVPDAAAAPSGVVIIAGDIAALIIEHVIEPVVDQVVLEVPAAAPESQWEDLAERRAGAMAREQALALKHAAPVRTLLARVLRVHTDERAWRIGADGEEKVAARLAKLAKKDPRWRFLHAIPVGENGSDIDHIVIGPGGVYTLNAKHHPGARIWIRGNAFRVNGTQVPYVRNSRHEAERASRYLTAACGFPVDVAGIVVPVGADSITIKEAPLDVHVVTRMALSGWLRRRTEVLDGETVAAVFDVARRSTTWRQKS